MMSRATKRTMFVLSGPDSGRSVVMSTISRLPPSRSASSGWSSPPSTAARSARTSSSFSLYGREASVASWARFSLDAATNCIARVICLMFLTEPIRRRMSRWLATWRLAPPAASSARKRRAEGVDRLVEARCRAVRSRRRAPSCRRSSVRIGRALRLEEAVELALELADARRRDVVQLARRRRRTGSRPASRRRAAGTAAA